MNIEMTSMERVLTALSHKEPDRVPMFLLLSMFGAKEMGVSIKEYFSIAENVAKTQVYMRKKYRNDCFYAFYYAAIEVEAYGGEVIFSEDGPPNAGEPIIKKAQDILTFTPQEIKNAPCLLKVLNSIEQLKANSKDEVPIIGVVMSPFSIPVMQMGFDKYLDLIVEEPELFDKLMKTNEEFCVEWANAQLSAGATAICYFDPVSSMTIIPRDLYMKTGYEVARRTLSRIKGPTATHLASGRSLPIIDDIAKTGTLALGVSPIEDISEIKSQCRGKLSVLGNLNGIEMCSWNSNDADKAVKEIVDKAAAGGGFILSDSHGEIPFQVKADTLLAISEAVNQWGKYPTKR
jgi:uroporphyrinogen decarboxylase